MDFVSQLEKLMPRQNGTPEGFKALSKTIAGRPIMQKVKFDSVYKAGEQPGELAMIQRNL